MDAKAIPIILAAVLKHQAKEAFGEQAIEIAGGDLNQRLDTWLRDQTVKQKLEEASVQAAACFLSEKIDHKLKERMIELPLRKLPKLQSALAELPDQLDQKSLKDAIRMEIERDWVKLSDKQKDEAVSKFLACINNALGTIDEFRPIVIVQAVLRIEAAVKRNIETTNRIESKIDDMQAGIQELKIPRLDQPPLSEYTPPKLPKTDTLPEPGQLPPGSRILFAHNAVFTGREDDLKALAKRLLIEPSGEGVGIIEATAATGMGGLGKTQLAVEFCYRYGRYFQGVHWLRAGEDLAAEIAVCGIEMRLRPWPETVPEQVQQTLAAWNNGASRLVVLDNVEGPDILREWLPKLGNVRLLLTSRRANFPPELGIGTHPLETFTRSQSLELLRKLAVRLNALPDEEVEAVAERLGDLPLALDLAGRYLNDRPELTPADYLEELEQAGGALQHSSLLDWVDGNPTATETNLAASFMLSWQRLDGRKKVDKLARKLFISAGYCAPNVPIPRAIFVEMVKEDEKKPEQVVAKSLKRLGELGLLTLAAGDSTIHPLMSEFGQTQDDEQKSALSSLANALAKKANELNEVGLPLDYVPIRPHVEAVAKASEDAGIETAGSLWNSFGYHLHAVADFSGARSAYERALKIDEGTYGPDHPDVANDVNDLGGVLQDQGDLAGAQAAFERALKIDEATYGPDHPRVAIRVNNLGSVLKDQGDLAGAQAAYERALKIGEAVYGPDHPKVAIRVNNLGGVLRAQGDLAGAQAAFERALKIGEAIYGKNHPQVAIYGNNLGRALQSLGDQLGARAAFERALKIGEATYGEEHPQIAFYVNNLGLVLRELGDLAGAKAHVQRALRILEQFLPAGHPRIEMVRANLAVLKEEIKQG